jgi:hypothetical protein
MLRWIRLNAFGNQIDGQVDRLARLASPMKRPTALTERQLIYLKSYLPFIRRAARLNHHHTMLALNRRHQRCEELGEQLLAREQVLPNKLREFIRAIGLRLRCLLVNCACQTTRCVILEQTQELCQTFIRRWHRAARQEVTTSRGIKGDGKAETAQCRKITKYGSPMNARFRSNAKRVATHASLKHHNDPYNPTEALCHLGCEAEAYLNNGPSRTGSFIDSQIAIVTTPLTNTCTFYGSQHSIIEKSKRFRVECRVVLLLSAQAPQW